MNTHSYALLFFTIADVVCVCLCVSVMYDVCVVYMLCVWCVYCVCGVYVVCVVCVYDRESECACMYMYDII